MKEQISNYATMAFGLLDAATNLSNILSWSPDEKGFIRIRFSDVAEIILAMQQSAKRAADELSWIASGCAELSEICPCQKGGSE